MNFIVTIHDCILLMSIHTFLIGNFGFENKGEETLSLSENKYHPHVPKKSAQEVAMSSIGSLRVYEMMLGLCFITIVLNWILIN